MDPEAQRNYERYLINQQRLLDEAAAWRRVAEAITSWPGENVAEVARELLEELNA